MRYGLVLLVVLAVIGGCKRDRGPATVAEARAAAAQVEQRAAAARKARELEDARKCVADVELISKVMQGWKSGAQTRPADQEQWNQAEASLKQARRWVQRAEEDALLADRMGAMKVRLYRTTRKAAVPRVLQSLALAAGRVPATMPVGPEGGTTADLAASLVVYCDNITGDPLMPSTTQPADWAEVSRRLNLMAADPPPTLAMVAAAGWISAGQNSLAITELELATSGSLDQEKAQWCHVMRAFALSSDGLPGLATEEMALAMSAEQDHSPEVLSVLHILCAYMHIEDRDYIAADREASLAIRACPDNPMVVFFTGEKLAANGEYEPAAESLEKAAQGTRQQWLAEMLAARAREIRDAKGEVKPLLADPAFVGQVISRGLMEAGKGKLADTLDRWQKTARGWADLLPK